LPYYTIPVIVPIVAKKSSVGVGGIVMTVEVKTACI